MSFLNKRKVSKTIIYYISEIIIVVIGIFVAIQLNNLNQNRINKKEEIKSLQRINTDLHAEKYILNKYKEKFSRNQEYLKNVIYNKKEESLDSMIYYLGQTFIHFKMNSEYINLKSSGKLSLISSDTLRYKLLNLYEFQYTIYDSYEQYHKKFSDKLYKYLGSNFPSDTTDLVDPKLIKTQLKELQFRNLVIDQIGNYKSISKQLNTALIDSIIKRIETH